MNSELPTSENSRNPGFTAQGITKSYGPVDRRLEVLNGVDLALTPGESVAIVGVSGTGKTTLLHILGTLDRPDRGTFLHDGHNIFKKNDTDLAAYRNRAIGFVFQFHNLLPEFSALENVMMPGLIARGEKQEITAEANDLLNRVGLAKRTSHQVGELSGGEQQRVALARALIMKPALLLADEPTGNLDAKTGSLVFELLQEMSQAFSLTTVMATHNLDLAGRLDRCLTLADGTLHDSPK